jgi:DNA-directed RNA polymerase II subunit RPB2
VNNTIG